MAKKLLSKYKEFLESEPIVTSACVTLSDAMLVEFVIEVLQLSRRDDRNGLEESLAWYLFEEIGWPEGCRYVKDAVIGGRYQYLVDSLRRSPCEAIHSRLELRRSHWKRPSQDSFITAHTVLGIMLREMRAPAPEELRNPVCISPTPHP